MTNQIPFHCRIFISMVVCISVMLHLVATMNNITFLEPWARMPLVVDTKSESKLNVCSASIYQLLTPTGF